MQKWNRFTESRWVLLRAGRPKRRRSRSNVLERALHHLNHRRGQFTIWPIRNRLTRLGSHNGWGERRVVLFWKWRKSRLRRLDETGGTLTRLLSRMELHQ